MAYTLNRRIAELIDSNGQLTAGKIAADYITNSHIADNTLTTAQLHTSFVIGSSHIPANTVTINHLAVTDGTANQVLKTDGSGTLSFTTIETNSISQGNTNVTVSDTGTDGKITMTTEGTARWEVTPTGHILPLLDDTYDIGSASKKIRDIYVSTGSIKMGADTVLSINSDGDFEINDASGDPKKIKVDEIEIGTGTDKLILKRGTDGKLESRKKVNGTLQAAEKLFSIASHTTDDITEGSSKLFYTDARTRAAISGTGSLSYNSSTGVMSFTMPAQNTSNITEGTNLYFTNARADARVALIVDSAPGTLNTLNELAAALGDDANFSTTITNSIAAKLPLTGGALTGAVTTNSTFDGRNVSVDGAKLDGIETGATADQTAAEILTAVKTVDGSGSGLDADLLDGQHGSYYAPASSIPSVGNGTITVTTSGSASGGGTFTANQSGNTTINISATDTNTTYNFGGSTFSSRNSGNPIAIDSVTDNMVGYVNTSTAAGFADGAGFSAAYSSSWVGQLFVDFRTGKLSTRGKNNGTWQAHRFMWDNLNDGSGSGLDADTVDGVQAADIVYGAGGYGSSNVGFASLTNAKSGFYDVSSSGTPTSTWYSLVNMAHYGSNHGHQIAGSFYSAGDIYNRNNNNTSLSSWAKIWNTANDGAGSGLDADLLDGANSDTAANANTIVKRDGNGYIHGVYFNSAIGISEALSLDITKIYVSNDNYIRTMGKSDFKIRMGLTKSDYDRMDYSSNTRYHIGSNSHNDINFNQLWARGSGFIDNWNTGSGKPPSGTHFNGFQALHYTDGGSYHHGMQMAMSAGNPALTFLRGHWANGGTGYSWQKIWTDGNDGSGSGLDSDLLDGQHGTYYLDQAASRARTASSYSGNQDFSTAALQFQSSSSGQSAHSYAIFQEGGAWSHPYPDLRIAYHTGIKLGAYTGYGGTRFYSNSDMVTLLFSVGNGDSNVRVTNNIYATQFLYNSDRAYKENIYPLENSLQKVLKLEGVNYTLKSDGTELIGFIAQDVEKIEPKVVDGKEGEKAVNYGQMVALLTEAMKEQQNMIVALQKEVKELKNATK